MSPRLAFALDAAHKAGRFTLSLFQTGTAVDLKQDETPVTAADRGAERLIRELIAKEFPQDVILGEEEGGDKSAPNRWVIDPIDGTKSFVSGVPLYSTLLSYEVDYQPIVAVCYFPALDEMVYAEIGNGAFFNGRPCHVSSRTSLDGAVLCCGGLKQMDECGRIEPFLRLSKRALAARTWNDAYGHALVATGRVDAMIDPSVSLWDVSAMHLIVHEAGGRFTNFDGQSALKPSRPDGHHEVVNTNGHLHHEILAAFRAS